MICKKCGAYNPDHATFCKVCAANLKDQTDTDEAVQAVEEEETVDQEFRPKRGNVKAPDFSSARRSESFKSAQKAEKPLEDEKDDEDDYEDEEEEKPSKKRSAFSHSAAPAKKKRRVIDEDDDEDDDEEEDDYDEEEDVKPASKKSFFARPTKKARPVEEDDEDEEEEDEDEGEAEKLESEPETTRFARPVSKKRYVEEDDDEDDKDEDDDEDEFDDEDDDDYEEYEPTPPRRKKSGRNQRKGNDGGSKIVALLIVCLLAILLIIVGIIAFCNIKGGSMKAKLPTFLQFNCSGKATTDRTTQQPQQQTALPSADTEPLTSDPTEAPVTGTPVDYAATELKEFQDNEGKACIGISMYVRPHDTVTVVFPNRDDYVVRNDEDTDKAWMLTIYKEDYYPNTPVEDSVYTVTPQILVTHADGTQESLLVDSFDLILPTVQLELTEPAPASIPEEGIMAAEGNRITIKGKVDDHYVTVTVNGQPIDVYKEGAFDYTYTLSGEGPETITIEASKAAYVPTSYAFTATPYVFVPEAMPLTVESDVTKLKADKNQKVTVTGMTAPGATLTATPAEEYQSSVVCGAPTVDAEGRFSFEVTFDKYYYGIATINLHAKKEGYEEGEASCMVSRMYADQNSAVKGYSKTKSYHEVYKYYKFDEVMAAPSAAGLYRFAGKIAAIDPETGVVTVDAEVAKGQTATIYVLNASDKWEPDKHVGDKYFLYCTLNGLYTDNASLYVTVWFIKKTK